MVPGPGSHYSGLTVSSAVCLSVGWEDPGAVHIYLGRYEQQKKARSDPRIDVEGQMGSSPLDPKWDLALNPLDGSPPFAPIAPKRRTPPAESL